MVQWHTGAFMPPSPGGAELQFQSHLNSSGGGLIKPDLIMSETSMSRSTSAS